MAIYNLPNYLAKDGFGMSLNIRRGNPNPLDNSSVWASFAEAQNYAKTDPVAYVGQILSVVNKAEDNSLSVEVYTIANEAGDLQEVGSAVLVDETNIVIKDDESLSLKDFGKRFYKFIEATGSKEDGSYVEAHYELTEVSETNPWAEGLEPKVVSEEGKMVLGWFEPNLSTIEGINDQVTALRTSVQDIQAVQANTYTKDQVNTEISKAVANADHLSRVIVGSLGEITTDYINNSEKDATKFIFMVPTGITADDDKYDEYIVIKDEQSGEQNIERVGSWEIDLSGYVKKEENARLMTTSEGIKLQDIEDGAEVNKIQTVDTGAFTLENRHLTLNDIAINKVTNLQTLLDNKVEKVEGSRLLTTDEATKLSTIEGFAQVNIIDSVDTDYFTLSEDKKLGIKPVDISFVNGLQDALDNKVEKVENSRLMTNEEGEKLNSLANIKTVSSNFQIVDGTLGFSTSFNETFNEIGTRLTNVENTLEWGELTE